MTDHLSDVISRSPEIETTTLEQVPEALKQVADYINSITETVESLSPYPVPEEANALQAKVA